MLLRATVSTAASMTQVFSVKSFTDFDESVKTKFARFVLPACFCSFAFASNSVLVFTFFLQETH